MIWSGDRGSGQAGEMQMNRWLGTEKRCKQIFSSTPRFANSYIWDLETFTSQMRKSLISQIRKLLQLGGFGENLKLLEFERMLGLRTMIHRSIWCMQPMKYHSHGNCLSDCWGITFQMFNRNLDARIWFAQILGKFW
jgi:hypothetical protein